METQTAASDNGEQRALINQSRKVVGEFLIVLLQLVCGGLHCLLL